MDWLNGDFVRSLSAPAVLFLAFLGLAYAGYKDRNARQQQAEEHVKTIKEWADNAVARAERETARWREAFEISERARERQAEGMREALDIGRTATSAVDGLRLAMERVSRESDGGRP